MSLYTNEFTDITGWTAASSNGTVTAETVDERTCAKFQVSSPGTYYRASIFRDLGSCVAEIKLEITIKASALGVPGNFNCLSLILRGNSTYIFELNIYANGIYDHATTQKLCDFSEGSAWQKLTFYCDNRNTQAPVVNRILIDDAVALSTPTNITPYDAGGGARDDGTIEFLLWGFTEATLCYIDRLVFTDEGPVSGVLKEKESDASGSPEHYLIINPASGAAIAAGTAEADGSFTTNLNSYFTPYALIMPDKDGNYAPTCLSHYITGA